MILGKAQSSTYFYCGLLRDLTVGILRYGGVVCGWPVPCHMLCATHCSLATCSGYRGRRPCVRIWGVTGLGKWLHLFSCRIFFSRIYVLHPDPALTPWEAKSKCKSAIFCRIFPSALGRTCPAMTTDQCRGETEFVTKISRVGHQQVFFCSCQLLMGAWVPIQEISLSHAGSSQSQSPRNQTAGCVFWVSAQCASESLYQQH